MEEGKEDLNKNDLIEMRKSIESEVRELRETVKM